MLFTKTKYELFSCRSNNNFAREIRRRERGTPAISQPPRRKDLVIYGMSGLFSAGTSGIDNGIAPSAFDGKSSEADGEFSRNSRDSRLLSESPRVFSRARHPKAEGAMGWRKATIINAALGSKIGWASYLGNRLLCLASNRGSRIHLGRDTTRRM